MTPNVLCVVAWEYLCCLPGATCVVCRGYTCWFPGVMCVVARGYTHGYKRSGTRTLSIHKYNNYVIFVHVKMLSSAKLGATLKLW